MNIQTPTDLAETNTLINAQQTPVTDTGVIVEDIATGAPKVISVVSSASSNTFGDWAEIDASVSADSWICSLSFSKDGPATVDQSIVIEVGIGAAGSEAAKVRFSCRTIYVSEAGTILPLVYPVVIPIFVAAGTRIAIRAADQAAAAGTYKCSVQYYQGL